MQRGIACRIHATTLFLVGCLPSLPFKRKCKAEVKDVSSAQTIPSHLDSLKLSSSAQRISLAGRITTCYVSRRPAEFALSVAVRIGNAIVLPSFDGRLLCVVEVLPVSIFDERGLAG